MALINCPECGKEVSDQVESCIHCGYTIVEDKINVYEENEHTISSDLHEEVDNVGNKRYKKSITTKSIITTSIAIMVLISLFVFNNNSYAKFKRLLREGNTKATIMIFNEMEKEDKDKARNYLTNEANKIEKDFINNKVNYDEASSLLQEIGDTGIISQEVSNTKKLIDDLYKSRKAYINVVNYFEKGDFKNVITEAEKVIERDEDYESAKEYKDKAIIKFKEEIIDEAKELAAKKDFIKAIDLLEDIKEMITDAKEIETLLSNYKVDASNSIIAEAKAKYESGEFDGALGLLRDNQKYSSNNNIQEEIKIVNQLKTENDKSIVLDIKNRITINYDEVKKEYKIAPKGYSTRYVNIGRNVNIEPRMTFDSSPMYIICVGFQQNDWVFFKQVIFAIDDTRDTWDLDYFSRGSDVIFGGGIAEWYLVAHSELLAGYHSQAKDMAKLMDSIIKSNNATIRFQGDGYRDHTITNKEKQTIKDLWTLYNILEENPSLFEILK